MTDTRPRLVAGSADGYSGHIDGKLRDARMNHPKGLTVDDRGNIYIADTDNMAIRKISDAGDLLNFDPGNDRVALLGLFVVIVHVFQNRQNFWSSDF